MIFKFSLASSEDHDKSWTRRGERSQYFTNQLVWCILQFLVDEQPVTRDELMLIR